MTIELDDGPVRSEKGRWKWGMSQQRIDKRTQGEFSLPFSPPRNTCAGNIF
jgi:hypothetical protein